VEHPAPGPPPNSSRPAIPNSVSTRRVSSLGIPISGPPRGDPERPAYATIVLLEALHEPGHLGPGQSHHHLPERRSRTLCDLGVVLDRGRLLCRGTVEGAVWSGDDRAGGHRGGACASTSPFVDSEPCPPSVTWLERDWYRSELFSADGRPAQGSIDNNT
jgi:hypothetical protein